MSNSILLLLLSIGTVIAADYNSTIRRIVIALIALSTFAILIYLLADKFSLNGLDEAFYAHIGHVFDLSQLVRFWPETLTFIIISLGLLFIFLRLDRKLSDVSHQNNKLLLRNICRLLAPVIVAVSILLNPFFLQLANSYQKTKLHSKFALPENFNDIDQLAPPITYTSPIITPNFVVIFAESLEDSFINAQTYPKLMPKTRELIDSRGFRIKGIKEVTLSNWTDAGLVAALCGASMTIDYSDYTFGDRAETEFIQDRIKAANIIGESCIGDILSKDGYSMNFYGGSDFGEESKTLLFRSQGFKSVTLNKTIEESLGGKLPKTEWGIYDDSLLKHVMKRVTSYSEHTQPKGEVLLTVDTHVPGYISPTCVDEEGNRPTDQFLKSVNCADMLISEFITNLLESPQHADTVIFLISDHLHRGELPGLKIARNNRDYLFAVFNSRQKLSGNTITKIGTALDIGPTILAHLGYEIKTLNFGRNLMSSNPTLAESIGLSRLSINIVKLRHKMRAHWKANIEKQMNE